MAASFWVVCNGKRSQKCWPEEGAAAIYCGLDVQDIYFTLEEEGGLDNYQKATVTLNKYLKPQANVPYERLCFQETNQLHTETVEQFVSRLRQTAKTCEFGYANAVEEQICDQVISKCLSHKLHRKLLQKGQALTLQQLREIARTIEESEKQARLIEGASDASNEVNSVRRKVDYKEDSRTRNVECFCFGNVGHKASDHQYPARGKQCRKCNGTGHIEAVCKTNRKQNSDRSRGAGGMCRAGNRRRSTSFWKLRKPFSLMKHQYRTKTNTKLCHPKPLPHLISYHKETASLWISPKTLKPSFSLS